MLGQDELSSHRHIIQQTIEIIEIEIIEEWEWTIYFLTVESKSSENKTMKAINFHRQSKILK